MSSIGQVRVISQDHFLSQAYPEKELVLFYTGCLIARPLCNQFWLDPPFLLCL
jgi:hypothetical protein